MLMKYRSGGRLKSWRPLHQKSRQTIFPIDCNFTSHLHSPHISIPPQLMFARPSLLLRAHAARRCIAQCRGMTTVDTPPAPPLLLKAREDLKSAMRSKDTNRLNAIRALLAVVSNANKTAFPPTTNAHVLALIHKKLNEAKTSIEEFKAAGRDDLVAKEQAEMDILSEYASAIEPISTGDLENIITEAVKEVTEEGSANVQLGTVMKKVFTKLEASDKGFFKGEVAATVKRMMESLKNEQ
ncbi:Yqey-like protein-domain-containing protein [Kalaharituber pfeilii]|nr:Yqey-like protein-domain-containing protein [Kalaharituber pfeilii]